MVAHSIMFHQFFRENDNHFVSGGGSINAQELDDLINYYELSHNLLGARDWYCKLLNNSLDKNDVCLSFDDGLKCQYEVAYPVLKKHNLTAFFFIPTKRFEGKIENLEVFRHFRFSIFENINDFYDVFFKTFENSIYYKNNYSLMKSFVPEDYLSEFSFYTKNDRIFRYIRNVILSEDEYDELMYTIMQKYNYNPVEMHKHLYINESEIEDLFKNDNIIGLHSHSHYTSLAHTSYDNQRLEYATNKKILEEIINHNIDAVSYPCNSYNNDTLKIMKELDIKLGFRANMQTGYNSVLEIPREDHSNIIRRMKDENYSIYK